MKINDKIKKTVLAAMTAAFLLSGGFLIMGRQPEGVQTELEAFQTEAPQAADRALFHGETVNINTASQSELEKLSGIGPALAQRIIDYRSENGRFSSVDELIKINGIGENKLEAIREYVRLEG